MKFSTKAIHVGQQPDELTGAVTVPIYQTSTYAQEEIGKNKGYEYARTANPTRDRWQECIAALEEGTAAYAFASGLAATDSILRMLSSGDHVIMAEDMYGGTYRLATKVFERYGLTFSFVDMRDVATVSAAMTPSTRMVFTETPTNPMMTITDLRAVANATHAGGALLVVDNTFASPFFQRPLTLGADIVVHSATKYLGGHSDLIHGVVITRHDDIATQLGFIQNAVGAVPGPLECWLCLRSVKTLHIRMERHAYNAQLIATHLEHHAAIQRIYYPGLPSHPQHALAASQMDGFGGMISIELGSREKAVAVTKALKIFTLAESLGGVESLVCHPVSMTHGSIPVEQRLRLGITDGLIRLSVGIEDVADLIEDLDQALSA